MDVEVSGNKVVITGNIKGMADLQKLKAVVDPMVASSKDIVLDVRDSLSMTSSVIGYLNKLVLKDGVNIVMQVGSSQLMSLLEDLNLKSTFNAVKSR